MEPRIRFGKGTKLRYGENPHQEGWFYETDEGDGDPLAIQKFRFLQGKELSYNNYLDMDGALFALSHIVQASPGGSVCVVVKHTNPCGAAVRGVLDEAYDAAWYGGDPLAAFGSVIAVNREVGAELAEKMTANFFEILIAPSVSEGAREALAKKPNIRVMINPALERAVPSSSPQVRQVRGGMLVASADDAPLTRESLKAVTKRAPSDAEIDDLLFAWAVCRSSKSNTVVAAKGKTLVASGVGQQDRKRCAELCVSKAGERMKGAVAASDAFFPFRDATDVLVRAGVTAIIQPGGSVRDRDSIAACDEAGVAMAFTGIRAFRH